MKNMPRRSQSRFFKYYGCPEETASFVSPAESPQNCGFFSLGNGPVCYGRCLSGTVQRLNGHRPPNALPAIEVQDGATRLPFDLDEVIDNLRLERYAAGDNVRHAGSAHPFLRSLYYLVRPYLSDSVRGTIKRFVLRDWEQIHFPHWPVDTTVEDLMKEVLRLALKEKPSAKIPFIWFWPEGASGAIVMTHDVETAHGRDACAHLMDVDDSYSIKSSFQVVPEQRYKVDRSFLDSIVQRGFELNVQDLNHDGRLFENHAEFQRRAARINRYVGEFGAQGFRSGVLYRNLEWLSALDIAYDMSVPNVAHLDPQRGGCCTLMPYFIGDILELPLTTTQDYMLFDILHDHSMDLWKTETETILDNNGLASFLVHPDYLRTPVEQHLYEELLDYLQSAASEKNAWIALPSQVNQWWRERSAMKLTQDRGEWKVEGPGSERARVAYALLDGNEVVYEIDHQVREYAFTVSSFSG
jgi:hypothetical protein